MTLQSGTFEPSVTVRLKGGLGNQLFEYAAARAVALRNGAELRIDALSGFKYDHLYQRHLKIDKFRIHATHASPRDSFMDLFGRARRVIVKAADQRRPWHTRQYLCEEPGRPTEDLTVLRVHRPLYLDGLWQSEDYFKDIEEILRGELRFQDAIALRATPLRDEIQSTNSVSVHVRRLFIPPGRNRPVPVEDDSPVDGLTRRPYYEAAIDRVRGIVTDPHFYIFSDFPDWARANLRFPGPVSIIENSPSEDQDLMDLHLMSLCRHHIIAASTFSWWGAWLSRAPGKVIFAPSRGWHHPRALPDSWETI